MYRRVCSLVERGSRFMIVALIFLINFSDHQEGLKPVKAPMGIWIA